MKPPVFLGLDIGTSSVKAVLVGLGGTMIRSTRKTYNLQRSADGSVALSIDHVLLAVFEAIRELTAGSDNIAAVTAASFGEAFIRLDRRLEPLGGIMMYTDSRGKSQLEKLAEKISTQDAYRINGCGISSMYSLPKIMWLQNTHPGEYEATRYCLPVADFILWKLGGCLHSSHSLAARTMAFDIVNLEWSAKILSAAGVDSEIFPSAAAVGTDVGQVSREASEATGLSENTRIIAGGHDQVFAAIGAGLNRVGTMIDGMGSVECLTTIVPEGADLERMHGCHFVQVPYLPAGLPVTYAFSLGGGDFMAWFSKEIYQHDPNSELSVMDGMIEAMAASAEGVLVLPHLNGSGTPYMDSSAAAAISGISATTDRSRMIRGMLNSLNYEMMLNLELLEECGFCISRIIATGGGTRSSQYMQLKADLWNRTISISSHQDGGALGAAIVAAAGQGTLGSIQEGIDGWTASNASFEPRASNRREIDEEMNRYRRFYPAMKHVHGKES